MRQHQRGFVFRREVAGFNMLVHLAKARHGAEMAPINPFIHHPWISSSRPNPGNAAPGNDDLLIVMPAPPVDVEQAAHPDSSRPWTLAHCDQRQVLADTDFIRGIDKQVGRLCTHVVRP